MKNKLNIILNFLLIVFIVLFNVFSQLKFTADGIIGSSSTILLINSIVYCIIFFSFSFMVGYRKNKIAFINLSILYSIVFVVSFMIKSLILVFFYMITPFIPLVELLNIDNLVGIIYIIIALSILYLLEICSSLLGKFVYKFTLK